MVGAGCMDLFPSPEVSEGIVSGSTRGAAEEMLTAFPPPEVSEGIVGPCSPSQYSPVSTTRCVRRDCDFKPDQCGVLAGAVSITRGVRRDCEYALPFTYLCRPMFPSPEVFEGIVSTCVSQGYRWAFGVSITRGV